jgi:drug/metabolite transporter (DMT)-like permease
MGELAALGTAMAWATTSIFFTLSGQELGSSVVNRMRLLLAVSVIMVLHWITMGELFPVSAAGERWWWLGVSGLIGLALGDALLFQAFVMIGPRLSMLVMSLVPVISTVLAWVFMHEILNTQQITGILLTVGGIAWVVGEKDQNGDNGDTSKQYGLGLMFAFGGAVGQATGLITSKMGLLDGIPVLARSATGLFYDVLGQDTAAMLSDAGLGQAFPAFSGLSIRLLFGAIAVWSLTIWRGEVKAGFVKVIQSKRAARFLLAGTLTGPIFGVWLSLVAVQFAPVGVASTLIALTPIFLLPIGVVVFNEAVTRHTIAGTLVAFGGTALLFL